MASDRKYQTYRRLRDERSRHDAARENLQDMAGPERRDRPMRFNYAGVASPGGVGEVDARSKPKQWGDTLVTLAGINVLPLTD